jgi:hypothetical protein
MNTEPTANAKPNKTDAGNGAYDICRVINAALSPVADLVLVRLEINDPEKNNLPVIHRHPTHFGV